MIRRFATFVMFGLCLVLSANLAQAQQKVDDKKKDDEKKQVEQPKNSAAAPAPRDKGWLKRHDGFVEIAKKGDVDVLFLGDSITDGWRGSKKVWEKSFGSLKAANFGIGGDQTQHVLWRIQNGELDGITPKVAIVMIGTNNGHKVEQVAEGITAIVKTIQEKSPKTRVLLLGIFPRGEKAEVKEGEKTVPAKAHVRIAEINKIIAKLDNGKSIRYLDIGSKFTQPDGSLTKEIMPDFLHLSSKGYEIWAEAITPLLNEMLKSETK